jgi:hypothetical protein
VSGLSNFTVYTFTVVASNGVGRSLPSPPSDAATPLPVPSTWPDFDGDGSADRGVYRPEVGGWYVDGQAAAFLGLPGDVPVPGDFDGDGVTERAVFRDGSWFIEGEATRFWGQAGDVPVPADCDGDGDVEPAVFRDGSWFIQGQAPR